MSHLIFSKTGNDFYVCQNKELKDLIDNFKPYRQNAYLDLDDKFAELPLFQIPPDLEVEMELKEGADVTGLSVCTATVPFYMNGEPHTSLIEGGAIGVKVTAKDGEFLYVFNPGALKAVEEGMMVQMDPMTAAALKAVGTMVLKKFAKEAFKDFMPKSFEETVKEELAEIKSIVGDLSRSVTHVRIDPYQDKYTEAFSQFFLYEFIPFIREAKSEGPVSQEIMRNYYAKLEKNIQKLDDNVADIASKLDAHTLKGCSFFSRVMFDLYLDSAILSLSFKAVQYAMAENMAKEPATLRLIANSYDSLKDRATTFANDARSKLRAGRISQIEWVDVFKSPWLQPDQYEVGYKDRFGSDFSRDPLSCKKHNNIETQPFASQTYGTNKMMYDVFKPKQKQAYEDRCNWAKGLFDGYSNASVTPKIEILENAMPSSQLREFGWQQRLAESV